jgi:hypothetical protein
MKTILVILLTSIMITGSLYLSLRNVDTKVSNTDITDSTDSIVNEPKVEKIISPVSHGLYKVQLNDSTTILIYRGVESCTMIQLK